MHKASNALQRDLSLRWQQAEKKEKEDKDRTTQL